MFCFETAVKLLYWCGFVYEHEEVSATSFLWELLSIRWLTVQPQERLLLITWVCCSLFNASEVLVVWQHSPGVCLRIGNKVQIATGLKAAEVRRSSYGAVQPGAPRIVQRSLDQDQVLDRLGSRYLRRGFPGYS